MENNQTLIFGIRAIIEAINSGNDLEKVYLQKELHGDLFKELKFLIRKNNISSSFVPVEKLNNLSKSDNFRTQNHQGAVARISSIKFEDLDKVIENILDQDKIPLFLLLDQISDVRNLGAIIRTAECTGVDAIIIPTHGSAPINADAIKTSAGAAFKLPICKVDHILDAVYQLQAVEIQIVAITEKTNTSLYDIELTKPTALVLGSEHKGISNSVLKISNFKGKIPLLGTIESLNVSVACGVALYEIVRQKQMAS